MSTDEKVLLFKFTDQNRKHMALKESRIRIKPEKTGLKVNWFEGHLFRKQSHFEVLRGALTQ